MLRENSSVTINHDETYSNGIVLLDVDVGQNAEGKEGFRNDLLRDLLNYLTADETEQYVNRRWLQILHRHMG